jgi:hypothetical protein
MAEFTKICRDDYGLKQKPTTTRNPQSNAIIERFSQTIGNIIRSFDVTTINKDNPPWAGILAATMFTVRATYHTTLRASPIQLVFSRDAILNIKHVTDWDHITQLKQEKIKGCVSVVFNIGIIRAKCRAESIGSVVFQRVWDELMRS